MTHGKHRGRMYTITSAVCDRCGCLVKAKALTTGEYGIVCASLIRCEQRRRSRLATGSALQSLALEELR